MNLGRNKFILITNNAEKVVKALKDKPYTLERVEE